MRVSLEEGHEDHDAIIPIYQFPSKGDSNHNCYYCYYTILCEGKSGDSTNALLNPSYDMRKSGLGVWGFLV